MALELSCAMLGTIAGNAAPALAAQDRSENVSVGMFITDLTHQWLRAS
jgi:hypothetical protein